MASHLAYEKEVCHSKGRKRKLRKGELAAAAVEAGSVPAAGAKVFRWKRERKK